MKRLRHPNIIKYEALYVDTKKRTGWLVMEYISLPSLSKARPKTEDDLKEVMFQIVDTLTYLHRQDIVHRDIKPENILYDVHENNIKVIDFGVSKRFRRKGNLTEMWTNTGTLYYRAPELFTGGYREGVDVWAAGILLYKLVAGRTPFESEYLKQTI
jgi:calcium-dependent protein kinase